MIYGGHFDPEVKKSRIKELEIIMNSPNFWDDKKSSDEVLNELNQLKNKNQRTAVIYSAVHLITYKIILRFLLYQQELQHRLQQQETLLQDRL